MVLIVGAAGAVVVDAGYISVAWFATGVAWRATESDADTGSRIGRVVLGLTSEIGNPYIKLGTSTVRNVINSNWIEIGLLKETKSFRICRGSMP